MHRKRDNGKMETLECKNNPNRTVEQDLPFGWHFSINSFCPEIMLKHLFADVLRTNDATRYHCVLPVFFSWKNIPKTCWIFSYINILEGWVSRSVNVLFSNCRCHQRKRLSGWKANWRRGKSRFIKLHKLAWISSTSRWKCKTVWMNSEWSWPMPLKYENSLCLVFSKYYMKCAPWLVTVQPWDG